MNKWQLMDVQLLIDNISYSFKKRIKTNTKIEKIQKHVCITSSFFKKWPHCNLSSSTCELMKTMNVNIVQNNSPVGIK